MMEASRECLALIVARRLRHEDVLAALAELFIARGPAGNIRSDNGSEFIATTVQKWLAQVGVKTLYITPASPWENGRNESFNGSLRDELLNGEIFYTLTEARVLIEAWRRLQYRPPAQQPRLPTAGPGNRSIASAVLWFRFASPPANTGDGGNHALTIKLDHSMGAGQACAAPTPVGRTRLFKAYLPRRVTVWSTRSFTRRIIRA